MLINNAGVAHLFGLDELDEAGLDEMWEVNAKTPLRMIHLVLPHLRKCGHGRIINISSAAGKRVRTIPWVGYAMTKFAVQALTHATRQAAWDDGVRTTAICPGLVDTDMIADFDFGVDFPVVEPTDVADLISTLLRMPNNAAVPEVVVNCEAEPTL